MTPAQLEFLAAEGKGPRPEPVPFDRVQADFVAARKAKGLPYDPALEPAWESYHGKGATAP